MIQIKKSTGAYQEFSHEKLANSLRYTGATEEQVAEICDYINEKMHEGITTRKIYNLAFNRLRRISRPLSAYYGTKRALLDLGPDGFIFEKYVAKVMESIGFKAITNLTIEGQCVDHEVDVIAENEAETILIECKFHSSHERRNDLKTALYIKARSLDIFDGPHGDNYDDFWLVSNTSFSEDAIRYATCAGLRLWGANFPPQNTLQDIIREQALDPVTCLSTLKKQEKRMLLESEILLVRDLLENPDLLHDIGLGSTRARRVISEAKKLITKRKVQQ